MGHVSIWERFLDSLDTPGGHIFTLVVLAVLCGAVAFAGYAKAEEAFMLAFGALLTVLRTAQSNATRRNDPTTQHQEQI